MREYIVLGRLTVTTLLVLAKELSTEEAKGPAVKDSRSDKSIAL